MSDREKSKEQLLQELARLRAEVKAYRRAGQRDADSAASDGVARRGPESLADSLAASLDGAGVSPETSELNAPAIAAGTNGHTTLRPHHEHVIEQVRHQLGFLRELTDGLGEGLYVVNLAGEVTYCNPTCEQLLGWQQGEMLGRNFHDLAHYQHADGSPYLWADCPLHSTLHEGRALRVDEDVFTRKDGSLVPVSYLASPLLNEGRVVGGATVFHDLSARKRAQRGLALQYAISRTLLECATLEEAAPRILRETGQGAWDFGVFWLLDDSGEALDCFATWAASGPSYAEYERASREAHVTPGEGLVGRVWHSGKPEWVEEIADAAGFRRREAAIHDLLRSVFVFPVFGANGLLAVIEMVSQRSQTPEESLLQVAATLGNQIGLFIERKQAEMKMRESHARRGAMLASALDAIVSIDDQGRISEFNPAAERLFGYERAQVIGQVMADLIVPPALRQSHQRGLERYLVTGETRLLGRRTPMSAVRSDGTEFPIELAITRNQQAGNIMFTAFIRDMTEVKRAEEERARLLESERAARAEQEGVARRLQMLQSVTDTALAHTGLEHLMDGMLTRVRTEMQLDDVAIMLLTPEGRELALFAAQGPETSAIGRTRLPLGYGMSGRIMRERKPLIVEDISRVTIMTQLLREKISSLIGVPLQVEDTVLGVLFAGTVQTRHFSEDDTHLLLLVADRIAMAIDRTRLYEAERAARHAAEAAQGRVAFLAEASGQLASSLDYKETLRHLAQLTVPYLADWCIIRILRDDNMPHLAAVAYRDPRHGAILEKLRDSATWFNPRSPYGMAKVLRTGEPELLTEVSEEVITQLASDDKYRDLLRQLDSISAISVPLRIRGRVAAAMTLISTSRERLYGPEELALAEELARRAAMAIDNARLYTESQASVRQIREWAHRSEQQAIELQTIIEAIPGTVFVSDATGHIVRTNRTASFVFGGDAETVDRTVRAMADFRQLSDLSENPLPLEDYPLEQALRGTMRTDFRCLARLPSGQQVPVQVSFAPIVDSAGEITGAVAVATDISGLYALEQQKDEFLSVASHELKTPLTTLKILAQLTRKRLEKLEVLNTSQVVRMERAIGRMERLVNDLLDVTRIQAGKLVLRLELCDLVALCQMAADEQEELAARAITRDLPAGPVLVWADPERLEQVLANLLSNALKYSPAETEVTLTMRLRDGEATVEVADHGIGIPREAQIHLFDQFYRVPGVEVQSGSGVGLGLGLFISHNIIQRHGWRITVESAPGKGSCFRFSLPVVSEPRPAAEKQ
ncbi:MAG: hypothetical protein OJF49_003923 [Ktedonobacterales bacterium]|jgi:PAS domain S-box-containing protein|nr:MAG: hypothetical protein OJF49_003923 [Ktedonobacterales bacterium]